MKTKLKENFIEGGSGITDGLINQGWWVPELLYATEKLWIKNKTKTFQLLQEERTLRYPEWSQV